MCISNVYTRMMHFVNKGDVECGHAHSFDHGTLVSNGSVLVEILNINSKIVVSSKEVTAPNFIFIGKDLHHRITSLENNTVCACIHALKTTDGDLIDPDFLIDQLDGDGKGIIPITIATKLGKNWLPPAIQ
jgi:hypothetical protein